VTPPYPHQALYRTLGPLRVNTVSQPYFNFQKIRSTPHCTKTQHSKKFYKNFKKPRDEKNPTSANQWG